MSEQPEEVQDVSAEPAQMSDIAKELNTLAKNEITQDELETLNTDSRLEADIEVPESTFWDNADPEANEEPNLDNLANVQEESSDVSDNQTITFKANGEDLEISLDEARKRLAMAEGGAKAFTKLAKANKQIKELESAKKTLAEKAALLDKLEEVKHDWKSVLQIATGQDPDQFIAEVIRKERIRETGSEADIRQLEKEERLAQLERQLEAQQAKQAEIESREMDRLYSSEKAEVKSMLDTEFFKHKFDLGNEVDSNDVNEMLWTQGRQRMAQYVKKYQDHPKFKEMLPKIAQKSFEDVSGKLKRLTTGSVQAKVDEAIKQKKQNAAEKAAVASTSRMSDPNSDNYKGMSIREIADKLVGKKKFTF